MDQAATERDRQTWAIHKFGQVSGQVHRSLEQCHTHNNTNISYGRRVLHSDSLNHVKSLCPSKLEHMSDLGPPTMNHSRLL
jgi:hypothetical protein